VSFLLSEQQLKGNVEEMMERIRENLEKVNYEALVRMGDEIAKASRIFIVGRGRSEFVGKILAIRLLNKGYKVHFVGLDVVDLVPRVEPDDLLIAISGSGETHEVVSAVRTAKEIGCRIVAVTSYPNSTIGSLADFTLKVEGREEKTGRSFIERTVYGELEPPGALFELSAIMLLESLANTLPLKK